MTKLKVMTVLGTRPEIIRLSRVMAKLDHFCEHMIVHTGQNYDYELNEVFFKDLGVGSANMEGAYNPVLVNKIRAGYASYLVKVHYTGVLVVDEFP